LPLVAVMVWKCWNFPPAPVIRWWAIGGTGMTLGMLAQMWRADLWRCRYYKLEREHQLERLRFQQSRRFFPKSTYVGFRGDQLLDLIVQSAPDILLPASYLLRTTFEQYKRIDNGRLIASGKANVLFAALSLSNVFDTRRPVQVSVPPLNPVGLLPANRDVFCVPVMEERDANRDALRQVENATDSERVSGEELLESEELKRQLREAKGEAILPTDDQADRKS